MSDPMAVGGPGWWIQRLSRELDERAATMSRFDDYYSGRQPMLYAGQKYRAAFGSLFAGFADNFCGLVVDAVEERLDVTGFVMGANTEADPDAWRIWQDNDMDAWSQIAHTEALVKGQASVLVWTDPDDPRDTQISVVDPLEMAVATDRFTKKRRSALRRWQDDDGSTCFTLYLPGEIQKYITLPKGASPGAALFKAGRYALTPREVPGEAWPLSNPLGIVPVVPLVNRPRLAGRLGGDRGVSEIASIIPLQNALNKNMIDMLTSSEFNAFPQRYAVGLELEIDADTGKAVEPYQAGPGALWAEENPNVKFGEFSASDLVAYTKVAESLIQHIASITRTPAHYLLGNAGSFPSGESLAATETGLTRKAKRKQRFFGEAWEEVIRLAFKIDGDPRGDIRDAETKWSDAETRNEGVHVDSLVKRKALNVPDEILWEMDDMSPALIARAKLINAAATPPDSSSSAMPDAAGGGANGMPMMAATGAPDAMAS